ncbi:MAG: hypothetical protein ACQER7_12095, partial [Bacteroidota bacterium]
RNKEGGNGKGNVVLVDKDLIRIKVFVGELVKSTEGTPLLREAEALVTAGRAMPERRRSDSGGKETAWIRQDGAMAASL